MSAFVKSKQIYLFESNKNVLICLFIGFFQTKDVFFCLISVEIHSLCIRVNSFVRLRYQFRSEMSKICKSKLCIYEMRSITWICFFFHFADSNRFYWHRLKSKWEFYVHNPTHCFTPSDQCMQIETMCENQNLSSWLRFLLQDQAQNEQRNTIKSTVLLTLVCATLMLYRVLNGMHLLRLNTMAKKMAKHDNRWQRSTLTWHLRWYYEIESASPCKMNRFSEWFQFRI